MKIARKLLAPALIWFAILAAALLVFAYRNNTSNTRTQEAAELQRLESTLLSRLEANKNFALALALQVANNPQVQQAFAEGDRKQLIALTLPAYQALNQSYGLPQAQFHLPPATSFLRLHALDSYGDDLSSFRFTVLAANAAKKPVAGLEIGRGGLGLRGVVPVAYQDQHVGSFEYGLNVGSEFLESLKAEFNLDAQLLLLREQAEIATMEASISESVGPAPDWLLQASTLDAPIYAPADVYARVLEGNSRTTRLRRAGSSLVVLTVPLVDYSGQVIAAVDLIANRTAAAREANLRLVQILGLLSAMLLLGAVGFTHLVRQAMRPVHTLTASAGAIAAGDLSQSLDVQSDDELGALARAFNSMTVQLRSLFGSLERRVGERTAELEQRSMQLKTAAEVARDTLAARDLDDLLKRVVNLVRERFGFYHAGIFLVDEAREFAVLQAATGEAGRELLARRHRLQVGKTGIVGYVTATGKARIALDVGDDAVHFQNPHLPETRSEMALPLIVGDEVIGALDVQSTEPSAFSERDVEILQVLADQTAIAITNARLFSQNQAALDAARQAYTELSQIAWQEVLDRKPPGYVSDSSGVKALDRQAPLPQAPGEAMPELDLPILVRDQVVGVIHAHKPSQSGDWSEQELVLMHTLVEALSQSLESARLFEATQEQALRERLVGEVTARMRSTLEIESVLQTAAREMQQILKLAEVEVRLGKPSQPAGQEEPA